MTRTVAVTGGTGFVGAALIDALLARGDTVKALVRNHKKLRHADDVIAVEGSLEDEAALAQLASGADAFVHCAGLTHARKDSDFATVNVAGAERAAEAAAKAGARLVHISSLSAREPALSPYAASKRESEDAVARASDPVTLRLPAIYGPGDLATLPYFKLIKKGLALEPAANPLPRASILHVEDAAQAILAALDDEPPPGVYEVGDDQPEGRTWQEIGETLAEAVGVNARRIRAPRGLIAAYHTFALGSARLLGRNPEVRTGQVNEFFHPDWVAQGSLLGDVTSWRAATPLKEGFAKTVRWYQENGLL